MPTSIKITSFVIIGVLLMGIACKKQNNLIIVTDIDTIFVNDKVKFSIDIDFKVKNEQWKIVETNTLFSNVGAGLYQFPAKGIYTVQYTANRALGKRVSVSKKVVVYPLPGIIKNYWKDEGVIHGDISLWVKGTRYDGKYYQDSVFYKKKNGILYTSTCDEVYEPKVYLNLPGGHYKWYLQYKYFDLITIWANYSDSITVDGDCHGIEY